MLILQHLHLQNFMSIDELDLDFDPETMIAISGQNGSGKSTLLYAIAYLLTGYRTGESYRDYVKAGCDSAFLSLTAYLKGEPLYCEAELASNQKKGVVMPTKRKTIYKGITYLNSDHNQFIKENDLEYMESLIFFFQDSSKDIIDTRPSERASMLKKIFKFEFPDIVNKLKDKQIQNKDSIVRTSSVIEELKSRQFTITPLLREVNPVAVERWQKRIQEINKNLSEIGGLDASQFENVESNIQSTEKLIDSVQNKIEERENQISSWKKSILSFEEFLKNNPQQSIQDTLNQKKEQLNQHAIEYAKLKQQVEGIIKEQNIRSFEKNELDKQIKISETGVCHACGQSVGHDHVEKLKDQKDKIEKTLDQLSQFLSQLDFDSSDKISKQLEKDIQNQESLLKEYDSKENALKSYQDRIKENESMIQDQKDYLEKLSSRLDDYKKEKEKYKTLEPLIKQKEILLKESQDLHEKVNKAREDAIKNSERKLSNDLILKEKILRDDKLRELNVKNNDLLLSMNTTKTSIDIFESQFPSFLILQATQKLESCINDTIQRVFPYMKVKLIMQRAGVTFLYTPECDENEWLPVSMASGAQKTVLSLAYKTSLARLYGISCILLDEIDASCSDDNAEIIYKFVASLSCFQQLIFISHRPESFSAAKEINPDVITYVVEKGNYSLKED